MRIFKQVNKLCHDLLDLVDSEIDLEQQLIILQFIASIYWDNDSKTYFNHRFEAMLLKLSKEIINFAPLDINYHHDHVLHVMTRAFVVGGHTRVVYNWVKCQAGKHSVFFNDSNIDEVPDFLKSVVTKHNGEILLNQGNTLVEKAIYLFRIASRYKYIVLHHHPDDILPLLAFGNDYFKRPTFLYNHADHVWGCGYSVADRILDLSNHGVWFSEKYRGIPKGHSINVSIPVDIRPDIPLSKISNKKTVISMAVAYKFKPLADLNFQDFVSQLLDLDPQIKYAVIGVESTDPDWESLKKKYQGRVIFYGTLDKVAAKSALLEADLYVDSFPFGSATSIIEAIALGIPALSLKTIIQNMDSYAHISATNVQYLIKKCYEFLNLDPDAKQKIIEYNYEKISEYHSFTKFREKILALDAIVLHEPIKFTSQVNIEDEFIEQYSGFIAELHKQNTLKLNMSYFSENGLFSKIFMRNQSKIAKLLLNNFASNALCDKYDIYPFVYTAPVIQIFYAGEMEEFSESKVLTSRFDFKHSIYIFSLQNIGTVCKIRLDPINIPCRIHLKKFVVINSNKIERKLTPVWNNAAQTNEENYYTFYHNDPQLIFELPEASLETLTDCFIEMEVFNIISPDTISWTTKLTQQLTDICSINQETSLSLEAVKSKNQDLLSENQDLLSENQDLLIEKQVLQSNSLELLSENQELQSKGLRLLNETQELQSKNEILQTENQALQSNNNEYQYLINVMENTIRWKIGNAFRSVSRMIYRKK